MPDGDIFIEGAEVSPLKRLADIEGIFAVVLFVLNLPFVPTL